MSEGQVQEFLRCLAAKTLDYDEMLGAFVKRRTRMAHDLLQVTKNGPFPEYNCGNEPSFTAIVVDETGARLKYPQVG
jgi:hypothetical protein